MTFAGQPNRVLAVAWIHLLLFEFEAERRVAFRAISEWPPTAAPQTEWRNYSEVV